MKVDPDEIFRHFFGGGGFGGGGMGGGRGGRSGFHFHAGGGSPFEAFFEQNNRRQRRAQEQQQQRRQQGGGQDGDQNESPLMALLPLLVFALPVLLPLIRSMGAFVFVPVLYFCPPQIRSKLVMAYIVLMFLGVLN